MEARTAAECTTAEESVTSESDIKETTDEQVSSEYTKKLLKTSLYKS